MFQVAALNTLAFVVIFTGVAAVAWFAAAAALSPGFWRNAVATVLYSVLSGAVAKPVLGLVRRIVEVRYYM